MRSPSAVVACLVLAPLLLGATQSSWQLQRQRMVSTQIEVRGVTDERVLEAMREVPRHEFVPEKDRDLAYGDFALPIGYDQTISQPYIVAFMTENLDLRPEHVLYELGTGSGYQAAVASRLVQSVYSVEIVPQLAQRAAAVLARLGYDNVHVRAGDGWGGWPEAAPFDRIIVTAAAETLPETLVEQLRPGGRMILPLGPHHALQHLVIVDKDENGDVTQRRLLPVRFVPVTRDSSR